MRGQLSEPSVPQCAVCSSLQPTRPHPPPNPASPGAFGIDQATWQKLKEGLADTTAHTMVPLGGDCRKRCGLD